MNKIICINLIGKNNHKICANISIIQGFIVSHAAPKNIREIKVNDIERKN
jgi:hypothetical protein